MEVYGHFKNNELPEQSTFVLAFQVVVELLFDMIASPENKKKYNILRKR